MTLAEIYHRNPGACLIAIAIIIGTIGQVIGDSFAVETYPRIHHFGRFIQNLFSALPKAIVRAIQMFKGDTGKDDAPPPSPPTTTPLLVGFLVLASALALTQTACGHGAKACAVVDVAAESCKIVRYLAPDGTTEELTPDDLAKVAAAKKAARQHAAVTP